MTMGFFDRVRNALGMESRAESGEVQFDDALLEALMGRTAVTKEAALQIPTVSGGIDLIAGIVAATPIRLYRDGDGKAEEIRDDYRLPLLNDETGDTLNANEFWHAVIRDYYTGKGGYAYLNKNRGRLRSIHYVDESKISILRNEDPIFKDFSIQVNGRVYRPWDFFRILRNTKDGAEGIPITKENAELIDVTRQQMKLETAMARRGGNKRGFLKSEKRIDESSMSNLRNTWASLYANDNENMMILNKDLDFVELSDTSAEMQLDENKRTNAQEFAKIFHVSPEAMSGSENDLSALAKLAALPLMQAIECALNRDLLLEREKGKLYFAFDTKELLRGSMTERANFYRSMVDANIMQIDEVRYMEDMEPLGLGFIKIGLQDVLYDPVSKIVYTPNTNQSSRIGEGGLQEMADGDTMFAPGGQEAEARANDYIQDPETGKMDGSRPSGEREENGSEKSGEKDLQKQSDRSIRKGIKSLEKKIQIHENYINDPKSHVPDWDGYEAGRQKRMMNHWKREIRDFAASIQNRENELKRREKME